MKLLITLVSLFSFCFVSSFAGEEPTIEKKFANSRELKAIARIPPEFRNKIVISENTEEEIKLYCSLIKNNHQKTECHDLSNFKKSYYIENTSSGLIGRYEDLRDFSCLALQLEERSGDLSFLDNILELRELDPNILATLMTMVIDGKIKSSEIISKITNHPNYNSNLLYEHIIALQSSTLSNETNGRIVSSLLRSKTFAENPEYFSELLLKYSQVNSQISDDQKLTNLKDVWENGKGLSSREVLSVLSSIKTRDNINSLTLQILNAGSVDDKFDMLRTLSSMHIDPEIKSAEFNLLESKAIDEKQISTLLSFASDSSKNEVNVSESALQNLINKAEKLSSTNPAIFSKLTGLLFEGIISNQEKFGLTKALLDIGTNDELSAYNLSYKVREFQASGFIPQESEEAFLKAILRLPQTDKIQTNTLSVFLNSSPSKLRADYIQSSLRKNDVTKEDFNNIASKIYNETNPFSSVILSQIVKSPQISGDLSENIVKELKARSLISQITDAEISIAKDMLQLPSFSDYKEDLTRIVTGKELNGEETVKPIDF